MGYKTRIGKVKSHTGVIYNDEVDAAALGVVDGTDIPNIIFTDADPPIGGLRAWLQIRTTNEDSHLPSSNSTTSTLAYVKFFEHTHPSPRKTQALYISKFSKRLDH